MRRLFLSFFLAILLWLPTAPAQEVLDGVAAVVNTKVITFSEVRELVTPKEKAVKESMKGEAMVEKIKEIRLQAVNDLIDRQLILQEFETSKFSIPDHVIEERVQATIRDEFGGDRSAFLRTLGAQGFTMERFRQVQRETIIVQAMRSQQVKASTIVPKARVQAWYEANREEYTSEEQMKLRMIVIKGSEANTARGKMMEEIRSKITDGAAFEDLARMYSDDNTTQESGGDWGWINRRTLNESLTKAAFALKAGEVSRILEMGGSFYLLYSEARKPSVTKPLEEVRPEIEKRLLQEERQKAQQEWMKKLRKKAYIKIF